MWIAKDEHPHVAFIHKTNYITLHLDQVHIVSMLKISYDRLWKSRRSNCVGTVSKLDYINEKLVYGSICSQLPAESAEMSLCYVIHRSENMYFSWSEIHTQPSFCMQLSIDTNDSLAVNNDYDYLDKTMLHKPTVRTCLWWMWIDRQRLLVLKVS